MPQWQREQDLCFISCSPLNANSSLPCSPVVLINSVVQCSFLQQSCHTYRFFSLINTKSQVSIKIGQILTEFQEKKDKNVLTKTESLLISSRFYFAVFVITVKYCQWAWTLLSDVLQRLNEHNPNLSRWPFIVKGSSVDNYQKKQNVENNLANVNPIKGAMCKNYGHILV